MLADVVPDASAESSDPTFIVPLVALLVLMLLLELASRLRARAERRWHCDTRKVGDVEGSIFLFPSPSTSSSSSFASASPAR